MGFADRADAGRRLARRLREFRGRDVVVLGLPRGGVPVAYEVAKSLHAPLDVIVVRKLGVPYQPELAFGAIGEGGARVINTEVVSRVGLTVTDIAAVERTQLEELRHRAERLRGKFGRIPLGGRIALIVDDGVATGATARAACQVARAQGAARVIVAVPIGSPRRIDDLAEDADEVVCMQTPKGLSAVGQGYYEFSQTTDDDVTELLERARDGFRESAETAPVRDTGGDPPLRDEDIEVDVGRVRLAGHLVVPENPIGMVVFAHGSGSSRHSPRNRYVADVLNRAGLATLLFDLLAPVEEGDRTLVFDIDLLAERLVQVTRWLTTQPDTAGLPVGYFGASTGAAAALRAGTDSHVDIKAIVSRGGRADLAGERLTEVRTPTLLIVGSRDETVLDLNRRAQALIPGTCLIEIVPGATHLFEEPGTLEQAAVLAREWFTTHLPSTLSPLRRSTER
ncbi:MULTISPECIES: phosphoribosyltransferase family protein [unclassified Rhodococcus (in: high G+C Gram-positive bacteria)]|uniref:phosphoribosyltransferase family protein n=1 Tax=unclassified Rhodococcus (in: high G+C Gram-positive bacteria) TaxID=192944 RepID=UPI00077AAC4D|nr:phosphoribosyl transferase [Rhodococcus sp. LB1]PBC45500.1 phosphoribosyl transferase [Rhodococcus sp. ACPA1]